MAPHYARLLTGVTHRSERPLTARYLHSESLARQFRLALRSGPRARTPTGSDLRSQLRTSGSAQTAGGAGGFEYLGAATPRVCPRDPMTAFSASARDLRPRN